MHKKTIVVDRQTWVFGAAYSAERGFSQLLNCRNNQCCLGFLCEQCGIPRDRLRSVSIPQQFSFKQTLLENREAELDPFFKDAVRINDDEDLRREDREQQLQELFAKYGFELVFKNQYFDHQETSLV